MGARPRTSPVVLRVGQVMTGFGAGCGVGVGVCYPIALGSVPMLGDVVGATSSAGSRAFGRVGHKAFALLGRLGIRNLKAGVGCGVGIGHGFGIGIALKHGVAQQLLHSLQDRLSAIASQLQRHLPAGQEHGPGAEEGPRQDSTGGPPVVGNGFLAGARGESFGRSQKDVSSVLSAPVASTATGSSNSAGPTSGNEILRMLVRHQDLIEDLKTQNASIMHALSEQLNVNVTGTGKSPSQNFTTKNAGTTQPCFKCRISARRRRQAVSFGEIEGAIVELPWTVPSMSSFKEILEDGDEFSSSLTEFSLSRTQRDGFREERNWGLQCPI